MALRDNAGAMIDVPTGHGFCMLVKRELLDRIGPFNEVFGRGYGEENDFCCKAADLGYRNVAAAGVFVEHRETVSFGSEKQALLKTNLSQLATFFPEYTRIVMDYERCDDLRRARWALDGSPPRESLRGRNLVRARGQDLAAGRQRCRDHRS